MAGMSSSDETSENGDKDIVAPMANYHRNNEDREHPVHDDPILGQIGDTPLIRHPDNEQIFCKMERENPTLSHKDRLGVGMIMGLRESGELEPGQRVVEASSGNTAGAVALAANRLHHPCTIVMRENSSPVKMGFVKALDAELVKAPDVGREHKDYYQNVAEIYSQEHNAVFLNQYERELNRQIHYSDIGPELFKQIDGMAITHIVGAVSTGGIMSGIGQYINEVDPTIEIVGVDGEQSNIHRDYKEEARGKYDVDIEGLGQWRTTDAINLNVFDRIEAVSDAIAESRVKHEASDNGLLMGLSSGAVMEISQSITQASDEHKVVSLVHDGAEQYFHEVDGW